MAESGSSSCGPLLELSREETRRYCQTRGLQFRDDTGNLLMRFTRNRVRHQLMPQLETYNPRVKEALVRLARSASLEGDYLEEEAKRLWPRVASEQEGADNRRIILDAQIMAAQHPAMRRTLLRQAFTRLLGNARRLEETHLRAMDELLSASPGKELALPQEVRLLRGYGDLCLSLGGLAEADAEAPPSPGRTSTAPGACGGRGSVGRIGRLEVHGPCCLLGSGGRASATEGLPGRRRCRPVALGPFQGAW